MKSLVRDCHACLRRACNDIKEVSLRGAKRRSNLLVVLLPQRDCHACLRRARNDGEMGLPRPTGGGLAMIPVDVIARGSPLADDEAVLSLRALSLCVIASKAKQSLCCDKIRLNNRLEFKKGRYLVRPQEKV